jgi:hypothetical protein
MARVKSAVAGEGILAEEGAASLHVTMYLLFFIYIFFWIQYEIKNVSLVYTIRGMLQPMGGR